MIKANVVVDFPKWKKKIKNPEKYIQIKIRKLNKIYSFINKKQEFSILLTNKSKMKNLNYKFRKKISLRMYYLFRQIIIYEMIFISAI